MKLQAHLQAEVEGYFRVVKHKADAEGNVIPGTEQVCMEWKHNLILNSGLDLMATSSFLAACQVGTGSTTPVVSDTALQARSAGSTTIQSESYGTSNGASPYYGWRRKTYRFVAGTLNNVNVSELGIGPATTGPVMCRALVLDGGGSPTTITVLVDEVLDVTYEFRLYVPTANNSGTFTLATEGTTHDWVCSPCDVDAAQNTSWDYSLGSNNFDIASEGAYAGAVVAESNTPLAVTAGYAGTLLGTSVNSTAAYVGGTYYRQFTLNLDLDQGNFATGLGRVIYTTRAGCYQWTFTPKIAKLATKKLTLVLRVSWARKAI